LNPDKRREEKGSKIKVIFSILDETRGMEKGVGQIGFM
jgi:hypothetical protein